jgi:SOS response associated peptidase (SRAP)
MCNLYSLNKKRDAVARFLRVSHNRGAAFEHLSAIFPAHVAPVIRQSADGDREIVLMSWGLVLHQRERAPRRVTNVRDDKIMESRFWRGSFEERPLPRAGDLILRAPTATSSRQLGTGLHCRGRMSARRSPFPRFGAATRGPSRT